MKIFTRVLMIVGGIFLFILGIYCLATPLSTFASVSWMVALALLITGVSQISSYFSDRGDEASNTNGMNIVFGIILIVLGCYLMYSSTAQIVTDLMVVMILAIMMLIGGCQQIASAFQKKERSAFLKAFSVIWGVLLIIAGIWGLTNPMVMSLAVAWIIGFYILLAGINLIFYALVLMFSNKNH